MKATGVNFSAAFEALTDHCALRWQHRLFDRLCLGEIPRGCDLPTGLGKTSVIPIWTIALAQQVQNGAVTLPRRLVYVVNRRTVVDQATSVVEQIRKRLLDPIALDWSRHEQALRELAAALWELSASDELLLAVSTLRGELADNEEWKGDPARLAIIIGTIDMIGSKLLFSGYGDGRYWRAQHAGLVGQDSLIVHDEAHLTPAFSELLRHVADVQRQASEPRPVRVMELSATSRPGAEDGLKLGPEDELDEVVRNRLDARKHLHLHKVEDTGFVDKLIELSKAHENENAKVLIYVRLPKEAQQVADELRRELGAGAEKRIALLTGTIRGYERDQLVSKNPVYRAVLDPECAAPATVYLVSTSAGEVGIDLDADHMVCDLATLDSMIQRMGRVNRRGGQGRAARVDVVALSAAPKERRSGIEESVDATGKILRRWTGAERGTVDVCPRNLRRLVDSLDPKDREMAFAPTPTLPALTDILLDAWSLTSITKQMPGRPGVAPYLHGLTSDPPETYVAWRKEVSLLSEAAADEETLRDWFVACPIRAHEGLRDHTDRVKKTLTRLFEIHRRDGQIRDFRVVLLNERGEAEWSRLSDLAGTQFSLGQLAYRTIVLPVEAGGLGQDGALDAKAAYKALDVAEENASERRERWLLIANEEAGRWERLNADGRAASPSKNLHERERVVLLEPLEGEEREGESRHLVLMVESKQLAVEHPETAKFRQALSLHSNRICEHMGRIAHALDLQPPLKQALIAAARWHDQGKDRPVWQRYACNPDPTEVLAKSREYLQPGALGGYRHEFGSLLEAIRDDRLRNEAESDLILHLIAAHHGWARPYFEPKAWDRTRTTRENEEAAVGAMRRFGRLQRRFGRWGLAWLESLLRCADIAASKQLAEPAERAQRRESRA